jgi:hypothetical protein
MVYAVLTVTRMHDLCDDNFGFLRRRRDGVTGLALAAAAVVAVDYGHGELGITARRELRLLPASGDGGVAYLQKSVFLSPVLWLVRVHRRSAMATASSTSA